MTHVHWVRENATAWLPRAGAAVMPITVAVAGETHGLVPDLAHFLSEELSWGEYGDTIIPTDAAPRGTVSPDARIVGGLVVSLDVNQGAPQFGDGGECAEYSEVRLVLTQPTTNDFADLGLFLDRRRDVCRLLGGLSGRLEGAPAAGLGIDWHHDDWLPEDWR